MTARQECPAAGGAPTPAQAGRGCTVEDPIEYEMDNITQTQVSEAQGITFARMVRAGAFLEHAEVFGNHYGTPRAPVEERLKAGIDVLFDIDWQGAAQIRRNLARSPHRVVSVFILPPSMAELEARLKRRAQDPEEVIARRMAGARDEITHWREYDYVLVNDDLDRCFRDLKTVLDAERLRLDRDWRYRTLAERLLAEAEALLAARKG